MMASDDALSEAKRPERELSLFQGAMERPVLVAISAFLFFGCALAGNVFLGSLDRVKTIINVERLDLNQNTDNPTTLIQTPPLSIDVERADILSDQLISKVVGQVLPPPSSSGSSLETSGRDVDPAVISTAVLKSLNVNIGPGINELEISLEPDAFEATEQATDIVNAVAATYVDLRKREREVQKEQTLSWADKQLAYWKGAIDILRSTSQLSSSRKATFNAASSTDGAKLLNFLLDATKSAQAETLSDIRDIFDETRAPQQKRPINVLEHDYAKLGKDLQRLESISFPGDQSSDEQEAKPSNLQKIEEKLALFRKDLDELVSSGLLDKPAAAIILPASPLSTRALLHWGVAIPLAAAISILFALLLASMIARWQSGRAGRDSGDDDFKFDPNVDVLTDPHWPMKPHRRVEET